MKDEYSFMDANELIEAFKESRKTSHRDGGGVNYFVLDLVLGDYKPEDLAKLAYESGQVQALGYVCDVVKDSLPEENIFDDTGNSLKDLSNRLYALNNSTGWQHLSLNLPAWSQKLVQQNSNGSLNKKWHIYSPLKQEEIIDWFRVYRRDLTYMLQNVS